MPKPIFLISLQRSGTNLLRGLLDGHPSICAHLGEPFETSFDHRWDYYSYAWQRVSEDKSLFLPTESNNQILFEGFLDYLDESTDEEYFVFDIKYNSMHLLNPAWWERHRIPFILFRVARSGFPVLHLIRDNMLEVYCSMLRARQSQKFTAYSAEDKGSSTDTQKLSVDTDQLLLQLRYWDREVQYYQALLKDLPCPTLELRYDQLLENGVTNPAVRKELAEHLNVSDDFLSKPSTVKLGRKLSETIANYDEVREALSVSEFWELDRDE